MHRDTPSSTQSIGIKKSILSSFLYFFVFSIGSGLLNLSSHYLLESETDLEGQELFAIQNGISAAFMTFFLISAILCCIDNKKPVGRFLLFTLGLLANCFFMSAGSYNHVAAAWEQKFQHVPDTLHDTNILAYAGKISLASGLVGLTCYPVLNAFPKQAPHQMWSAIKDDLNVTMVTKKWIRTISTVGGSVIVIAAVDIATFAIIRALGLGELSYLLFMLPKLTAAFTAGLGCYPVGNKIITRTSPAHWRILFLGSSFTVAYFLSSSGFEYFFNTVCNFHTALHRLPLALQRFNTGTYGWHTLATTGGTLFIAAPLCREAAVRINALIAGRTDSLVSPLLEHPEAPISCYCCEIK